MILENIIFGGKLSKAMFYIEKFIKYIFKFEK